MGYWQSEMNEALTDFIHVARFARYELSAQDLNREYCSAPHCPPKALPKGKMAIYGFWGDGSWLKIGKAGPRSQARYIGQHYNPKSSGSNLARSLAQDSRASSLANFDQQAPGNWIRGSCHRVNILVDAGRGGPLLSLLEAFLHARLKPRYEGASEQE
jgi:hypothetical protein